jgi:hypothetical protein
VSRSLWRCRHPDCPVRHGSVLGRVTAAGGLVLAPEVKAFAAYFDTGRVEVTCPACGTRRDFRGRALLRGRFRS